MKLEIKKIGVSSVLFSSFSLMIFFTSLIMGIVGIFVVPNPVWLPVSFGGRLLGLVIYTLAMFVITMAYFVFIAFVYNFFARVMGMKGLSVDMEETGE